MPKFLVEIPVRVTRAKEIGVDYEPAQERSIKFDNVDAHDEEEAVDFITALLLAAYWDDEERDVELSTPKVLS